MLNDIQKIVDALDAEINIRDKVYRKKLLDIKQYPELVSYMHGYLNGLKKAQEIFLGSIDLPF